MGFDHHNVDFTWKNKDLNFQILGGAFMSFTRVKPPRNQKIRSVSVGFHRRKREGVPAATVCL